MKAKNIPTPKGTPIGDPKVLYVLKEGGQTYGGTALQHAVRIVREEEPVSDRGWMILEQGVPQIQQAMPAIIKQLVKVFQEAKITSYTKFYIDWVPKLGDYVVIA